MINIINEFIKDKNVAMVGVSRSPGKWGNMLFKAIKKKGYTVYPVNPAMQTVDGQECFHSVSNLPKDVKNVIFVTTPDITEKVLQDCLQSGIKRVWMHGGGGKGSQSPSSIEFCRQNGIEAVYDVCPMMFFPPVGFHNIHLWIMKIMGKFPWLKENGK